MYFCNFLVHMTEANTFKTLPAQKQKLSNRCRSFYLSNASQVFTRVLSSCLFYSFQLMSPTQNIGWPVCSLLVFNVFLSSPPSNKGKKMKISCHQNISTYSTVGDPDYSPPYSVIRVGFI